MYTKNNSARIPEKVVTLLNEQIAKENSSSFLYLSQAVWCDEKGFKGAAKLLYKQSAEERAHMLRIIDFLIEQEVSVTVPSEQKEVCTRTYSSLYTLFTEVYENELKVTASIHEVVATALSLQDYRTFSFLQWFLEEQREEERLAQRALELFQVIGTKEGLGLYEIDRALAKLTEESEEDEGLS